MQEGRKDTGGFTSESGNDWKVPEPGWLADKAVMEVEEEREPDSVGKGGNGTIMFRI